MMLSSAIRRSPWAAWALGGCLLILPWVMSCEGGGGAGPSGGGEGLLAERLSWSGLEAPTPPPVSAELLARGEEVFRENCSACHGEAGDGNGVCAPFLLPHPRDFTSGIFRFKSTPDSAMPTDRDLFKTVSVGLHGTGMPPWKFLLDEGDRWAVAYYVKTFSRGFDEAEQAEPVDLGPTPEVTPERIERGAALYTEGGCGQCHGPLGYGDGPSAPTLVDSFERPISPRNFHKIGQFKRGYTLRDIALTIHTGNNGTPMPSFGMAFDKDQIWDLAAYIMSLGERKLSGGGEPARADAGTHLGEPDVIVELRERHWKFVPDEIHVKQGQVVRIDFQPTDNGLGAGHGFAIDGYDKSAFINGALVQRPKSVTFVAEKSGTFTFYCASQCSTGDLHPNMNGKLIVEPAGS